MTRITLVRLSRVIVLLRTKVSNVLGDLIDEFHYLYLTENFNYILRNEKRKCEK